MFTYQTPCLRTEFEYRQRRRIVHIKRSIQQVTQFVIQLLPFIVCQLATLDFLTRNLAHVGYQTVHQLHVTHFKREQCYGITEIHGNVFCHGKYERRFTHGRTGCNNDEVGLLPSGSHLVQLGIPTFQATQTIGTGGSFLNQIIGFGNDRINLCIILLHVLLGNLE